MQREKGQRDLPSHRCRALSDGSLRNPRGAGALSGRRMLPFLSGIIFSHEHREPLAYSPKTLEEQKTPKNSDGGSYLEQREVIPREDVTGERIKRISTQLFYRVESCLMMT